MSPEYGQPEECILKGDGEMGGAYIVRLPAGDPKTYLRCGGKCKIWNNSWLWSSHKDNCMFDRITFHCIVLRTPTDTGHRQLK